MPTPARSEVESDSAQAGTALTMTLSLNELPYIANNGYADSASSTVTVTVQTPNPYRAFEAENYVAATGATIMASTGASGGKLVSVSNSGATIQYGRFEFGAPGPRSLTFAMSAPSTNLLPVVAEVHLDSAAGPVIAVATLAAGQSGTGTTIGTWSSTNTVHSLYLTVSGGASPNSAPIATIDSLTFDKNIEPSSDQVLARLAAASSDEASQSLLRIFASEGRHCASAGLTGAPSAGTLGVMAEYEVDPEPGRIDMDVVWSYLHGEAYWGRGRSRADVEVQVRGAWRVVGAYADDGSQVGFARAVSDGVAFAYLADVFVVKDHRRNGLGRRIVRTMIEDGPGADYRWLLHTGDATFLYASFGFRPTDRTLLERPAGRPGIAEP